MSSSPRLAGVMAAGLTAFNDDLSVDVAGTLAHTRWLLDNGCDGVLLFGTTGEGNSLALSEKMGFLDQLADSDLPRDRLMIGTGVCALPETIALTRKMLDVGIDAALMLPPFYFKNPSDDGLFDYFARVIDGVGDSALNVYLYHFPQMSAVPFSHDLIGRLLAAYPATVRGVKDSSGDVDNMTAMARNFPGFDVFAGTERYLLDVLRAGGAGTITATGNVTLSQCAAVYADWRGAGADAAQDLLTTQRLALQNYPAAAGVKELLARAGGRASWRNLRPPLCRLDSATADKLAADMAAITFHIPALAA
ncbi:MAG: dihydrodipicolinate synthase family protein [Thalassobaculaceae bacterium]